MCYNVRRPPQRVGPPMGRGATVAQRTLDPLIQVRILAPQPTLPFIQLRVSEEPPSTLWVANEPPSPSPIGQEDREGQSRPAPQDKEPR